MDSKRWISYSSISDFNSCLRLYYFKNIYRNPKTGNRIQLINPYLALGSAVHETIDEIINLTPSRRVKTPLLKRYDKVWRRYSGKSGGFISEKQEDEFRKRGSQMIKRFSKSSLIKKRALKKKNDLPKISLFKGIDLVGSFDWVEVLKNGNLHIIDFKTGRSQEKSNSWQLPIYQLLAQEEYGKKVDKLSYWYLEKNKKKTFDNKLDIDNFFDKIKEKALEIKEVVDKKSFSCDSRYHRCYWCRPYEEILSGKAEYVGVDSQRGKDIYFLKNGKDVLRKINDSDFLSQQEKKIVDARLSGQEIKKDKSISRIKRKIKGNLTKKELSIFVSELKKNGKKINI